MIEKTLWTTRVFNFDFPVGLFPNLMERVKGTPVRVEALVKEVGEDTLSLKRDGKWSIKEHIGHLVDLEELHSGRIDDFENGVETLRPADMSNQKTEDANHNQKSIELLLNDLKSHRADFVKKIENFDERFLEKSALHPRLQVPMRVVDNIFFVAEHDDHHLASISKIITG